MAKQTINIADKETLDAIKDKVFNGGKSIYFSGFNDEGFTKEFDDTPLGLYATGTFKGDSGTPVMFKNKLYVFCGKYYYVLEDEATNKWSKHEAPYNFVGTPIVYGNHLHLVGSAYQYTYNSSTYSPCSCNWYKFDGNKWTCVTRNLPIPITQNYNIMPFITGLLGDLAYYDSNYIYRYDSSTKTVTKIADLPLSINSSSKSYSVLEVGNKTYFGYSDGSNHYLYYGAISVTSSGESLIFTKICDCPCKPNLYSFNGELYIHKYLSTNYKLEGSIWTQINYNDGSGLISSNITGKILAKDDNELYMFYSENRIYKIYNDIYTAYSLGVCPMPRASSNSYTNSLVSYNNQLYIFGFKGNDTEGSGFLSVSKWDGSKWVKVTNLPYLDMYTKFVECNGKVHMLGGNSSSYGSNKHYTYDGSNWTLVSSVIPIKYGNYVSYKNNIYGVATQTYGSSDNKYAHSLMLYKYDGTEWVEQGYIPYCDYSPSLFVIGEKMYLGKGQYVFDDATGKWIETGKNIDIGRGYDNPARSKEYFVTGKNLLFYMYYYNDYTIKAYNKDLKQIPYGFGVPGSGTSQYGFNLGAVDGDLYISDYYNIYKFSEKIYHAYNAKLPAGVHIVFEEGTVVEPLENCTLESDGSLLVTNSGTVRFSLPEETDLPQYTIY